MTAGEDNIHPLLDLYIRTGRDTPPLRDLRGDAAHIREMNARGYSWHPAGCGTFW